MCNLAFRYFNTFNFYDGSVGEQRLKHLLDLPNFVVDTLPDDGTVVPKHVEAGT
jgi:hypothetical protein